MLDRHRAPIAAAAVATVSLFLLPGSAMAVCETPLVIKRTASAANVMILFDNSASMNSPIFHAAYNPTTSYSGNFDPSEEYTVASDGTYDPRDFDSNWPSSPSAYLVNSDGGQDGRYDGNYMNWVYSHASSSERAAIPRVTRIQVAKQVVSDVLAAGSNSRFGIMIFNGEDGGTMVSPMGTPIATLQTQVSGIVADNYTPLAETLVDILDYYKRTDSGAPIQAACQKSFVVIVTDGHPTKDLDIPNYLKDYDGDGRDPGDCASIGAPFPNSYDCSEYLDDVATYLFTNDMRSDLATVQNVTTYVVGFNIYAPILQSTATKGGGAYFSANDAVELTDALRSALSSIETKVSAGASVSVVSAEDRTNNRLYRARFESVTWRGFVEAFSLPYRTGDSPLWDAGALLSSRSASSRNVFTSTSGTSKADFTTSNASTLQSFLGAASVAEATSIIDYTRGTHVTGYRDRAGWKLGDIVDSSPIAVGKPSDFHPYLSYPAFRTANLSRPEVVYVGANDGMMHCFNANDGSEAWAYVPKNQLPRLSGLMDPGYCHNYFVNMSPAGYDIHVGGSWKTVLIGGQERGGSGLFALDVTDPTSGGMRVMWDLNIPALKGSWNRPELVRDRNRNAFVLAATTGLDETTGLASLLVLDPANGSTLATHTLGSASVPNMATAATAVDRDFDGFDDLLYIGDLAGRLWRVDVTTNPWTVSQLFSGTQPIQAPPVLTMDDQGRVLIFFGTGRYLTDPDLTTTTSQTFYGIRDDHSGTLITRSSLVDQTSSINPVSNSSRGWYIDLVQGSGERVIRTAALVAGILYFPSFRPNAALCQAGGESWLYSLDFEDGSAPDDNNGVERNTTSGRIRSMGDGVLSNPTVDLANEDIILQSSNATMTSQDIDVSVRRLTVRSWREVWD